jgi:transposase-like protein
VRLGHLPRWAQGAAASGNEVKIAVRAIWDAPNRATADLLVKDFIERFGRELPAATACLQDDLEACLSFLRCPPLHFKRIRTTNLIERAFEEQRRRTKTIPRLPTLMHEVAAWEATRNAQHATIRWQFDVAQARTKLSRLYPQLPS